MVIVHTKKNVCCKTAFTERLPCETYTLTDSSVLVKRGLSSTNEIPWSSITSVCPVSKGFRFGYSKGNGRKGFYVVINVKEVESMRQLMEERIKNPL